MGDLTPSCPASSAGILMLSVTEIHKHITTQLKQRAVDTPPTVTVTPAVNTATATAPTITTTARTSYTPILTCQFLEIYGEEVRCLLSPSPASGAPASEHTGSHTTCSLRDVFTTEEAPTGTGEVDIVGAVIQPVPITANTCRDVQGYVRSGMTRRVTGATNMNEGSSRSHAVFTVFLEQCYETKTTVVCTNERGEVVTSEGLVVDAEQEGGSAGVTTTTKKTTRSRLNFVDLAGSERQKRTGATGVR